MVKQHQSNNRQEHQKNASPRDTGQHKGGDMSVREAGHKGGQRVRELVDEGKQNEGRGR